MTTEPIRVLYIDDDPGLARLVQKALGRRGYVVENASNGEDGLKRLAEGGIDVVALDHYLTTGTGLDVLAAMASHEAPPPVVYVTGSAETAVAVAALKAGASDYVPKTVADEFLELLGSSIDQAMARAQLHRAKLQAEREVREARDRAVILLEEVNHRVANSLAMVASLVGLQANALTDPAAKSALAETQARISAIAGVHRRLYTSEDVRTVEINEYLESLVGELHMSTLAEGHDFRLQLDIEPISISTDKAVSLGVAVNELITNAFKYAYTDGEEGEVRIALNRVGSDEIRLTVSDDGPGWRGDGQPKGTGVGSRIVKAMAISLGSSVQYSDGPGTSISLQFRI